MTGKARETWSTVSMVFGLRLALSAKLMPRLHAKSSASLTTPVSVLMYSSVYVMDHFAKWPDLKLWALLWLHYNFP